jgi:hypothetical protein
VENVVDDKKTIGVTVKTSFNQSYSLRLESNQTIGDLKQQLVSFVGKHADQQEITVDGSAVADDVKLGDLPMDVIILHMRHKKSSAAEIVTSESTDPRRCVLM